MKYKANEINEILESIVSIYKELELFSREDYDILKPKVKKIKEQIQEKKFDHDFIYSVLEEERTMLKEIVENDNVSAVDTDVLEQCIFLIEELFEGIENV